MGKLSWASAASRRRYDAVPEDLQLALHCVVFAGEDPLWKSLMLSHSGLVLALAHVYNRFWVTPAVTLVWALVVTAVHLWGRHRPYRLLMLWESFWIPTILYVLSTFTLKIFRGVFCGIDLSGVTSVRQPSDICPAVGRLYWTAGNIAGTALTGAYAICLLFIVLDTRHKKNTAVKVPILRLWDQLHKKDTDELRTLVSEEAGIASAPSPGSEALNALHQLVIYFRFPSTVSFLVFKAGWLWVLFFVLQEVLANQTPVDVLFYVVGGISITVAFGSALFHHRYPIYRLVDYRVYLLPLNVFSLNITMDSALREVLCTWTRYNVQVGTGSGVVQSPPQCHRASAIDLGIAAGTFVVTSAAMIADWYKIGRPVWKALEEYRQRLARSENKVEGKPVASPSLGLVSISSPVAGSAEDSLRASPKAEGYDDARTGSSREAKPSDVPKRLGEITEAGETKHGGEGEGVEKKERFSESNGIGQATSLDCRESVDLR